MSTKSSTRPGDLAPIEPDDSILPLEKAVPNFEAKKAALLAYRPRLASDMRNLLASANAWAVTVPAHL